LLGALEIVAVGTQALRGSRNSSGFIKSVKAACGVLILTIDGDEEARFSYAGAIGALGRPALAGEVLVFDVGGGSSEIISGNGLEIECCSSLRFGALSLHRGFFEDMPAPIPDDVRRRAGSYVKSLLEDDATVSLIREGRAGTASCVGVGGTITTLASVMLGLDPYDPSMANGSLLEISEVERQIELYSSMAPQARMKIKGLGPKRADIILAGACIVGELMGFFEAKTVTVSDRGLRYGAMEKFFG
jgi:exopolyphosphatase/guanosine-5'-triphosphate,3'-diphosphate pyrophosphatase